MEFKSLKSNQTKRLKIQTTTTEKMFSFHFDCRVSDDATTTCVFFSIKKIWNFSKKNVNHFELIKWMFCSNWISIEWNLNYTNGNNLWPFLLYNNNNDDDDDEQM